MQHAQPLETPFPWRTAAVAACVLALAELVGLIALVTIGRIHIHRPAAAALPAVTMPAQTLKPPAEHALRSRSHVSVLVLNGNGVAHAAGNEATQLLGSGYRRATAADAPQQYANSLVLFRPGWEREARRLARDAGIGTVAPLDGRLQRADGGYQLVLVLGSS